MVSWASLVALCCSLVASWPPGSKEGAQEQRQGGQEPPKSRPGEAKRGPREPKGEPKVFRRARERPKREHQSVQESQGETQERPRERQRVPRQAQERPSDKHKLMSFPSVTRIHILNISVVFLCLFIYNFRNCFSEGSVDQRDQESQGETQERPRR